MKRSHIGMDEAMGAADMILVDWDGKRARRQGQPALRVADSRRDLARAARRACRSATRTRSIRRSSPRPTSRCARSRKEGAWFDDQPKFQETCSLIRTPELGVRVAQTLGAADAVFLMSSRHRVRRVDDPRMHDGRHLSRSGGARAVHDRDDRLQIHLAERRGHQARSARKRARRAASTTTGSTWMRRDAAMRKAASAHTD